MASSGYQTFCNSLTRKKPAILWFPDSQLKRCLDTWDLTFIGVGAVIGAGLYVVTGQLVRDVAGPAVVLSFLIAAVSATLSAICYAEFGCRIPRAGSAYVYSYVALGEIWAFIVGWNMVLEYVIAGAALARASSEYINSLAGGLIYKLSMKVVTWDTIPLGNFPDFLAMFLTLFVTAIVSLGARRSSFFNKMMTLVNLSVIIFIIFVGLFFADPNNWKQSFAPFGAGGVIKAASSCFFAFVGFDIITTASEEATNPKKSIPLSIVLSLAISTIAFIGVAATLTLMLSYGKLSRFAAIAEAFAHHGVPFAKYIVAVGGMCATASGLMTVCFAAARVIYSMAADGLLPRCFSSVNDSTHVPVRASIAAGLVVATLALLLDLSQLVELLSIGTLVAYTMVVIGVLLTRFQTDVESVTYDDSEGNTQKWLKKLCCVKPDFDKAEEVEYQTITSNGHSVDEDDDDDDEKEPTPQPTADTSYRASLSVVLLTASIACLCIVITKAATQLKKVEAWAWFLVCVFGLLVVTSLVVLMRQPKNSATFPFTVPCVPLLPTLTIFVNVLLLVSLNHWTYARFAVWMTLGAVVYVFYGYSNSIEGVRACPQPREYIVSETPIIQREATQVQRVYTIKSPRPTEEQH